MEDPTLEDWEDLAEEWQFTLSGSDYRRRLLEAISELEVGQIGRAELLTDAGEAHLRPIGRGESLDPEPDTALRFFQDAMADGGPTFLDTRPGIVDALLALGRDADADAVLGELRRDPAFVGGDGIELLAETLEEHGKLREAERWFSIGVRALDPSAVLDESEATMDETMCLAGRFRVRRATGKTEDAYDRLFTRINPEAAERIRYAGGPGL